MLSLFQSMTTRGKLLLGGSVIGIAVVAFMLIGLATKPSSTTLSAGLDPAATGKMTAALDSQGIAYQLANGGTAIQVAQADLSKARVALASKGLSATGGTTGGWDKFDQQKLGASNFQQKVAYQRALESQIAQTVGQVSGVDGATVQLTMPDDQLFADQQKPATAAVLLGGGMQTDLAPGAVRGIANLVASSVPNLKSSNVTITDGTGQMLWPTGDASGGGSVSKPAAESRYDAQLSGQLNAIIARTVGPDKAQVRVKSDLNVDNTQRDELQYAKTGIPIETTKDTERLKGTGGTRAGGAAGSAANVPTYAAAGAGAGGNSNYQRTQGTTKFGVGKVVTHTKVAPGAVQRLDVALMVDPSVPPKTAKALQQAISSAAGINTTRGDTITLSSVPFAKQPAAATKAAGPVGNVIGYAKYGALGLGSLFFLFFVTRHLRRREQAVLVGEPTWLTQIDAPRPVGQLAAGAPAGAGSMSAAATEPLLTSNPNRRRQQIEQALQREPDRVVQTLRGWMAEEEAS
jgi:flagellar M-ring protein FliF